MVSSSEDEPRNVPLNHRRKWSTSEIGNPNTKLSKLRTVSSLLESPQKNNHLPFKQLHASSLVKILNLQCAEYTQPLLSSAPTFPSHHASSHSSSGSTHTNLPSSRISHVSFHGKIFVCASRQCRQLLVLWRDEFDLGGEDVL